MEDLRNCVFITVKYGSVNSIVVWFYYTFYYIYVL